MTLLIMSGYAQGNSSNQAFLGGMKPIVFIGRILCVLSRDDVLNSRDESSRKNRLLAVVCGCISLFFLLNALFFSRANLLRFENDKSASEKLGELSLPAYAYTMCFVYSYQIFATKRFRNIVLSFLEANQRSQISIPFPATFPRFCYLCIIGCMTFGITENAMYDLQSLRKADRSGTNSTLELYYSANFYQFAEFVPYHPIIILIYVVVIKIGTWGWVYMDVIVIVLCRAVADKFRVMNQEVDQLMHHHHYPQHNRTLSPPNPTQPLTIKSVKSKIAEGRILSLTWDSVRDEFVVLTDLVLQVEKFVAPLILACYGANMYIIVINLLNWIAPYSKFSPEQSYYVYFAFVQFLFRVTIVTYFAAEVHHVSHGITRTLQRCPNSLYSLSLERLERTFICNPTGISLFGSFMITRKFFISIISFIFTTEIVLLQTANTPRAM